MNSQVPFNANIPFNDFMWEKIQFEIIQLMIQNIPDKWNMVANQFSTNKSTRDGKQFLGKKNKQCSP